MTYVVQADVEAAAGGSAKLKELTDIEGSGQLNQDVLDKAIRSAEGLINSYAQKRHSVPFDPVPDRIRELAALETVYELKRRRRALTEDDREEHEERVTWLRDLAKGLVSPGEDPPPPASTSVTAAYHERSEEEPISRESLKGFV